MVKFKIQKKGINIKSLEGLTIGDIKKLEKDFRPKKLNIKFIEGYVKKKYNL